MEKKMKILIVGSGTGRKVSALLAALEVAGAEIVQEPETFGIRGRNVDSVWNDELGHIEDRNKTYGPATKGRGGKVKRW